MSGDLAVIRRSRLRALVEALDRGNLTSARDDARALVELVEGGSSVEVRWRVPPETMTGQGEYRQARPEKVSAGRQPSPEIREKVRAVFDRDEYASIAAVSKASGVEWATVKAHLQALIAAGAVEHVDGIYRKRGGS